MGKFAVGLVLLINGLVPPTRVHRELASAKDTVANYQAWEYMEIRRIFPEFGLHLDLRGKRVLDIGSGLGGKLRFYAEQGVSEVVGIDLRYKSLQSASSLFRVAESEHDAPIHLTLADGAKLPFLRDSFDIIVSVNVLEHVDDPESVLAECRRVLAPDGLLFLHFPPFHSPWGPHLDGWINWPWPHLFFDEKDLVAAAACVEDQLHLNDKFIPSAKVNWRQFNELPELNRLTLGAFGRMVRRLGFRRMQWDLLPLGRHYLPARGYLGRLLLSVLRALTRLPLLNEVLTTKVACVLAKDFVSDYDG